MIPRTLPSSHPSEPGLPTIEDIVYKQKEYANGKLRAPGLWNSMNSLGAGGESSLHLVKLLILI
jgi:hypothetical protein